jgi:hypothetical protein
MESISTWASGSACDRSIPSSHIRSSTGSSTRKFCDASSPAPRARAASAAARDTERQPNGTRSYVSGNLTTDLLAAVQGDTIFRRCSRRISNG